MAKRQTAQTSPVLAWLPWLVAVAPFVAFFPALFNDFVWDDQLLLAANPHYRGLGLTNLLWMFSAPRFGQYHPLTWLSFALDYLIFGMDPSGYHAVNIALHCVNALLLFQVARRLLAKALPETSPENLQWAAAFAALFFALHPLRVETVAWITERRGLLSSFFLLGSTLAYIEEELAAALALYVLSLFCKASGVVFPVVLLLLDYYPLGRWEKRRWLQKIPFAVAALPFGLIAPIAQMREGAMQPLASYGIGSRLGQAAFGSVYYLYKTAVPWHLNPFVRFPDNVHFLLNASILASMILFAAITAAAIFLWKKAPAGVVLWGTYLAWLSPVSGLVQSGPHFVADRYSYLACLGWAVLAGAGAALGLRKDRDGTLAIGGAILVGLAVMSWNQTRQWKNPLTLWNYVLSVDSRSYLAHNNLCTAMRDVGMKDEALQHCQAALALRPDYAQAHCNLGNLLLDDGKVEDAVAQFADAIRIDPNDPIARFDLGVGLERMGRIDTAIQQYQKAIELQPDYSAARNNLGAALALQTHSDEAAKQFQSIIASEPGDAKAHFNLGNVYYGRQKFDLAEKEFDQAVRLNPSDVRAQLNLGVCLNALGRPSQAADHFQTAIRLKPDFAEAFNNLGIALFEQRKFPQALESFQRAVQLKPDYSDARFNLDRATKLLGAR